MGACGCPCAGDSGGEPAWLPPRSAISQAALSSPPSIWPQLSFAECRPGHSMPCAFHLHFPPVSCELNTEHPEQGKGLPKGLPGGGGIHAPYFGEVCAVSLWPGLCLWHWLAEPLPFLFLPSAPHCTAREEGPPRGARLYFSPPPHCWDLLVSLGLLTPRMSRCGGSRVDIASSALAGGWQRPGLGPESSPASPTPIHPAVQPPRPWGPPPPALSAWRSWPQVLLQAEASLPWPDAPPAVPG